MDILFQASGQAGIYNERVAISFGLATLAFALATFASCRSCVSLLNRFGLRNLTKTRAYQSFNRYHTYYWLVFGVSLVSHIMMAVFHTGLPQAGDPDANIHWTILFIGLASALTVASLFSSCRVSPRLFARAAPKFSSTAKAYQSFFKYHSYYWWIFVLLAAGHFTFGYLHAGIWPGTG